jgi:hypothetical protein
MPGLNCFLIFVGTTGQLRRGAMICRTGWSRRRRHRTKRKVVPNAEQAGSVPAGPAFGVRSAGMVGKCRADARKRAQIAEAPFRVSPVRRLAATWHRGAYPVGNVTVCRFVTNFVGGLPSRSQGNRLAPILADSPLRLVRGCRKRQQPLRSRDAPRHKSLWWACATSL